MSGENPKQMYGDMKLPVQNVPPALLAYAAWGMAEGGFKYGPWNFRLTNVEALTYVGATIRHLLDFLDGLDTDPDSIVDKPSLAGAAASLGILIDGIENATIDDNRPPKGNVPAIMKRYAEALERNHKAISEAVFLRDCKLKEKTSGSDTD